MNECTVYVVTMGRYSDYCICAVFSRRDLAERYIARERTADRWLDHKIEEWDLDPKDDAPDDVTVRPSWLAFIDCRSGEGSRARDNGPVAWGGRGRNGVDDHISRPRAWGWSAIGPDHAERLAAEARQRWLRERVGPVRWDDE